MRPYVCASCIATRAALGFGARRRPFAHAVHRQKRGLGIQRREKRRRGMRFMMLREDDFAFAAQFRADQFLHPDPFADPERNGHEK